MIIVPPFLGVMKPTTGLAPSFSNVGINNGTAYMSVIVGNIAYIVGGFTDVRDASSAFIVRNGAAALDLTTALWTAWNPNLSLPSAYVVKHFAGSIYLAGDFTSVGGTSKAGVAKVNMTTGALDTGFTVPSANQGRGIAFTAANMFVTTNATGVQKVNPTTGAVDGSWVVTGILASAPNDLTASAADLYVVGGFAGAVQGVTRNRACALAGSNAALGSWDPSITNTNPFVVVLDEANNLAYVGGTFTQAGGLTRNGVFQSNLGSAGVTSWTADTATTTSVQAISTDGTTVWIGGGFTTVDGIGRNRLASLDRATGTVSGWNPNADADVSDLQFTPLGAILALGSFITVGGSSRLRIALINPTTGGVL